MKTDFTSIVVTGGLSLTLLASCASHEQKADDAFDLVKEGKNISNDSIGTLKEIQEESIKPEPVKKNENINEWDKYKIEIRKKIMLNESKMKALKEMSSGNDDLFKKVMRLEKDNDNLRIQMDEYDHEMKRKCEDFKATIDDDINKISVELKELSAIPPK